GFGKIEGSAICFGDRADEVDEEANWDDEDEPDALIGLGADDIFHRERAREEQCGDEAEAGGCLVADKLGCAAQSAEERIVAVGGPAAEHDAVDAEGADGENEEEADIQVG